MLREDLQCTLSDIQCSINSCSHLFCFRCIQKWSKVFNILAQKNNTCPNCRSSFTSLHNRGKNYPVQDRTREVRPNILPSSSILPFLQIRNHQSLIFLPFPVLTSGINSTNTFLNCNRPPSSLFTSSASTILPIFLHPLQ